MSICLGIGRYKSIHSVRSRGHIYKGFPGEHAPGLPRFHESLAFQYKTSAQPNDGPQQSSPMISNQQMITLYGGA